MGQYSKKYAKNYFKLRLNSNLSVYIWFAQVVLSVAVTLT